MKLTLFKYIIQEIWPNFLVSLFVGVFIIVATRLLSIMEMIVTHGASLSHIFAMVVCLLPEVITFALPAAILIAVVVAFLRLSSDSEIIALKSSGIGIYQMLPPVITISLLAFIITLIFGIVAVPWGNKTFKNLIFQIIESRADLGIKEHIFCEPFDKVIFYVNGFSAKDKVMENIFVVDRRDKEIVNTIVAENCRILLQPQKRIITLRFLKGTIFMTEKDSQAARTIEFKTYDLNISLKDVMASLASRHIKPKEMSLRELIRESGTIPKGEERHNKVLIELLEKFSIPLAVFFMGIIGAPLGAQIRAKGRTVGIAVSLVIFFTYYMCLAGTRSICETGLLPPTIGVWIPNIFLCLCAVCLLRLSAQEKSVYFIWEAIRNHIFIKLSNR